jgi:hypothetical protein
LTGARSRPRRNVVPLRRTEHLRLDHRWPFLSRQQVERRIRSLYPCLERSPSARRCRRNPRAQLVPFPRPMLAQMDVGGVMACTHDHAPPSERTPPMFASSVHNRTLNQPMRSARGRSRSARVARLGQNAVKPFRRRPI